MASSVKDLNKFTSINTGVYSQMKSWASLKLIYLDYVAGIYSSIMKHAYPNNFFYVDLFAGAGIGCIEDSPKDLILGSAPA